MKWMILLVSWCGLALAAKQCCDDGAILMPTARCGDAYTLVTALNCTNGKILLKEIILSGDKLSTKDTPGYVIVEDPSQYCIGEMYVNATYPDRGTIPVAIVCFQKLIENNDSIATSGILALISVFFLLLTLAVYSYIPQLRDLQGLCYMCLCVSMALGFLSLGILQLEPRFSSSVCAITGFIVYMWMMATFFWMNVISINMYRTVQDANYLKMTERKQYFTYSVYAWGATLIFLTITLITNYVEGEHYRPGIGNGSCWFSGRVETWIFFYGPIAVLISVNIALFVLSSLNLWQKSNKYETNKLNNLKHRFLLSLKLFLVMGISWIFEIASFAHGESHIIWKIMDVFNCLQGVIIFLLLVVFRKRAIQGLAKENFCLCITGPLAQKLNANDDDTDDQHILADETMEVRLN